MSCCQRVSQGGPLLTCLLHSLWRHFEVGGNVASEHSRFEGLHVTTHIRLRGQEMPLVRNAMRIFMSIGHNNMRLVCFNLCVSLIVRFQRLHAP